MKLLFVSAELSPYARTGGLGEAVAGLAAALVSAGHDVTVVIPGYRDIEASGRKLPRRPWRKLAARGPSVLLFQDSGFDRPGIYGPEPGSDYEDNWLRFGRFAVAAAELSTEFDIVHLHDGHVGLTALLTEVPTVFTIHNASYPMTGPLRRVVADLDLEMEVARTNGPLEWFGVANFLKAGIVGSGQATTVSPGHARELTDDETSFGLGGVIRGLEPPLVGLLNGIDTTSFDPRTDMVLPAQYSAASLGARVRSRSALLDRFALGDGFVLGNVGRMVSAKGIQLLQYDIGALVGDGVRFVFVGNGDLDPMVDEWADRHPAAVVHAPYSESLARLVFAGCDAYLMPSEYEPSGLAQMYAMRYGAPPIAHSTGGLRDTVIDVDEDQANGTGFVFHPFDHVSLTKTIRRALRYHTALSDLWAKMQQSGMGVDWSWSARADEYVALYSRTLGSVDR